MGLAIIPMLWFLWAQGAKRCHDMDKNGWFQIIPFYVLWMIFIEGDSFLNKYGDNPKLQSKTKINSVVKNVDSEQLIIPIIDNDSTIKNNVTNMEVLNVNYSNFQDVLRQLRNIPFVKSLNNNITESHRLDSFEDDDDHGERVSQYHRVQDEFGNTFMVNSRHHQYCHKVAKNFKVTYRSVDGGNIPEGIEDSKLNIWAVQWHPERFESENNLIPLHNILKQKDQFK